MADPVLSAHHVRIAKQLYTDLKDNIKFGDINAVVVRHDDTEGVHLHMYLKHDTPCTSKTAKERFKAKYAITRTLTNGDWSWSDPKSLEGFWAYTMSGVKVGKRRSDFDGFAREGATCIVWGIQEPRIPDYPGRPDTPIVSAVNTIVMRMPSTKLSLNDKFLKHCQERFEGRERVSGEELMCEFIEYFKNGKNHWRMLEAVRYAEWELNDTPEHREMIKHRVLSDWLSKL